MVKKFVNAGDIRDVGSVLGLDRSSGGRHGNPLQYSCLENPMDRRAWQAMVHRITRSWTRLKQLSTHWYIWDLIILQKHTSYHLSLGVEYLFW